jgi:hypothetical protein
MLVIILVIIVIILVFILINKNNNNNNTGLNIFTQNNDDIVKEKEKSTVDINVRNIDIPQNDFNPFIYDRLYNPFYTYNYPYYNYHTSYPYNNYTYDIRPFPRQYPGRIHNYKSFNRNYNKIKHNDKTTHDGKRK